jgi:hypothetical protein
MLNDLRLTSDHHAIAPLKTPDTTAGSHVHIMNSPVSEIVCSADVIDVVGLSRHRKNGSYAT